jgi:type III pantothenate kinase
MNLAIDIGNSRAKTGLFVNGKLVKDGVYDSFTQGTLKLIFKENPGIVNSILCSVTNYPVAIKSFLSSHSHFVELSPETSVPVKIAYKTPKTLGMDRLAAVCGANALYQRKNVLVVNAGTCVTFDFVDNKNTYRGGSISPGLDMRYKALHTFTSRLPLIEPDMKFKKLIGANTEESIKSGVQMGIASEVEGIIRKYQSEYKDLTIILTGGSMPWLLKSLKIKIKAEPFLVLTGLNVILSPFHTKGNLASAERF